MKTRTLGRNGPTVSALGLGCMGMSEFYGPHSDAESLATLTSALDRGVTFFDTADAYGPYTNEELVGRALQGHRAAAFIATKFGFVPYSPLGRGFLTGAIRSPDDFAADDYRRTNPRFQGENFARNLALADKVRELAQRKGCTPAQLALAWVLAQWQHIVPIPGTRRKANLEDNLGALVVTLSAAELAAIDAVFPASAVAGARYPEAMLRLSQG